LRFSTESQSEGLPVEGMIQCAETFLETKILLIDKVFEPVVHLIRSLRHAENNRNH
jgi:hypothetical protein